MPRLPRKVPRRHRRPKRAQALHPSQPSATSATPATQSGGRCRHAPRLPRETKVVTGDHQARHQSQPSAVSVPRKVEAKKCTPLWREAHFQVKMCKTLQNTAVSEHVWKLRCRESARRCGAKHMPKSTCTKHTMLGPLLEVEMSKKVHAVVARSTSRSQKCKKLMGLEHFWMFDVLSRGRRKGLCTLSKVSKT